MNGEEPEEGGRSLVASVAGIVLIGVALGVAFNALQLASGPRHGLAWIKAQVKLASLESIAADAEASPADGAHSPVVPVANSATDRSSAALPDSTPAAAHARDTARGSAGPSAAHAVPAGSKSGSKSGSKGGAAASAIPVATKLGATTAPATPPAAGGANPAAAAAALPAVPDTKEPLEVQYATIKKFWDAGAAIFVDARSAEEYAEGHIPGAVNLPFDDVFKNPDKAKALDTKGRAIVVTYCGGGECDLSRNLAFSLIDAGQKKVLVFLGGVPGWKEAGNALVTGANPGTAP